jgi:NADH-quinone oxidoreductase subunit M
MHRMPLIGVVMVVAGLASLGLPGLSGFVAELTVFLGSLGEHPAATIAAVSGVVLAAGYILWMMERVFMGPADDRWEHLTDATSWWERTLMAGMLITIIGVGVFPRVLTDAVESGIAPIIAIVGTT